MDTVEHDLIILAVAINAYRASKIDTKVEVSSGQKSWVFKRIRTIGQPQWKWSFHPYYTKGQGNLRPAQWRQIGRYERLR